jgi:hypothetical protein
MFRLTALVAFACFAFGGPALAASFCMNDGSKAIYGSGGEYRYQRRGVEFAGTWSGSPKVGGEVQVRFPNGATRRDHFIKKGRTTYLVNLSGQRFAGHFCK